MSKSEDRSHVSSRNTIEQLNAYSALAHDFEVLAAEFAKQWNSVSIVCNAPLECNVGMPRLDRYATTDEERIGNDRRWQHWRDWAKSAGQLIQRLKVPVNLNQLKASQTFSYRMASEILAAAASNDELALLNLFVAARKNAHEMQDLDERFFQVMGEIFGDWMQERKQEMRRQTIALCRKHNLDDWAWRDDVFRGQLTDFARGVQFGIPTKEPIPIKTSPFVSKSGYSNLSQHLMEVPPAPATAKDSDSQGYDNSAANKIDEWHHLAARCINAVLKVIYAPLSEKPLRDGFDALVELRAVVDLLPPQPCVDPFFRDEPVKVAGGTGTSAHTAAFDVASKAWQAVRLETMILDSFEEYVDEGGHTCQRATSRVDRRSPLEGEWDIHVWNEVKAKTCRIALPDHEWFQAALAQEVLNAAKRLSPKSIGSEKPVLLETPDQEAFSSTDGPFIPSEQQENILEFLKGKSYTLAVLATKVRANESQLHRDSLKELLDRKIVLNDRRVGGYYRPDAPPEKVTKYANLGESKKRAKYAQVKRK